MDFSSGSRATGNYTADSLNLQVLKEKDTYIHGAITWDAPLPLLGPTMQDQALLQIRQGLISLSLQIHLKRTYQKNREPTEDKGSYMAFHHQDIPKTEVWSRRGSGISQIASRHHEQDDKTQERSWPFSPFAVSQVPLYEMLLFR